MTKQEAINAMQSHLGSAFIVLEVDLDIDDDWVGDIYPNDNDGDQIGHISLAEHGRCDPIVSWG